MTHYIAIIGAKGGCGKTTVVINLASALTQFGRTVIAVDYNIETPNLGMLLGFKNPSKTLLSAIKGKHRLHEAIFHHPSGLYVVPSAISHISIDYRNVHYLLHDLHHKAELVLLDTPTQCKDILHHVNECIIVTTADQPGVHAALKSIELAHEQHVSVLGIVINKFKETPHHLDIKHIQEVTKQKVIGIIHYDKELLEAIHHHYPVVYTHHEATATHDFKKIAGNLIGQPYIVKKTPWWHYVLERSGFKRPK
ncbi:MAG: P-loop NTPase [Candidatus Woesearchaeota archaeon]